LTGHITTETKGNVLVIRMNRLDKKNAITAAMYAEMAAGLDEAFDTEDVRAALLVGCPGVFTSGNDIGDFARIAMTGERSSMAVFDFLERMIMAKKPVVAGVDGLAIGIGTTMLMHCDHVIASSRSVFKTPFVDLGLVPEAGSSLLAPRLMGYHKAFSLLAMGEDFSAEEAHSAGLVNHMVSENDLEDRALEAAASLAAKPKQALEITRSLIRGDRSDILARMREEAEIWSDRLQSDEAKAAFMAFMSKSVKKPG